MLSTLHNHAVIVVVDKLEVKCSLSRTSNSELALYRTHPSCMLDHGAQPMAQALRRVGGAHRAPSGPRCARRSSSLFAGLAH